MSSEEHKITVEEDTHPHVSFHTFGCRSNLADTVDLVALASERGARTSQYEPGMNADVFVVNSCTVTNSADQEVIKFVKKLKAQNPDSKIILTGCLAEAKPEEMSEAFPDIAVLGPGQKNNVIQSIFNEDALEERIQIKERNKKLRSASHKTISIDAPFPTDIVGPGKYIGGYKLKSRFHLRVQEGCENHCTYCIIPQTRGVLSSRSISDVIADLRQLHERGYEEVVLTGTHLGGYGIDVGSTLLTLLKAIEEESPVRRIRLSSLDPDDVSFEIIDFISKSNVFCRHLHICLQAFTDDILKKMNRKYRMEDARQILWYAEKYMGGCSIGSDVITGFPGEGRKELEEGIEEFLSLPISYLHVFPYSEREGTSATRLEGNIPYAERKRRAARWRAIAERKKLSFYETLLGKTLDVIVEDKNLSDMSKTGTSSEFADIRILPTSPNVLSLTPGSRVYVESKKIDNEGYIVCELLSQGN